MLLNFYLKVIMSIQRITQAVLVSSSYKYPVEWTCVGNGFCWFSAERGSWCGEVWSVVARVKHGTAPLPTLDIPFYLLH